MDYVHNGNEVSIDSRYDYTPFPRRDTINSLGPPPLPLLLRSTILISGGESPSAVVRVILKERCVSLSSGIATQTILTIPVSHVTNNQMVNLALSNGQVVSTTLANLQSLAQPQNMLNTPTSNGK